MGHEITHVLEGTGFYETLKKKIISYAKSKGDYDARLDSLTKIYKKVKDADIENELTADLVGDYLFTDEKFIKSLTAHKNLFRKLYDEIKYLWNIAKPGSKEKKQLTKVKRAFEKAFSNTKSEEKKKADTKKETETKKDSETKKSPEAEKTKNTTEKGDVKYSISEKNKIHTANFQKRIDAWDDTLRDFLLLWGKHPHI